MIRYGTGNLLGSDAEALVNTVNTVGVMGKGIALMFKEAFPDNFAEYAHACAAGKVHVGKMMITERAALTGPRWIINFPTKQHWRHPSRLEWISAGLDDLRRIIESHGIKSVAIPPLGAGNGGLNWSDVKHEIERHLHDLPGVDIHVYEPSSTYQNVAKRDGVQKLTPARALIAEAIRRYWILDFECSLVEAQKLAWFVMRVSNRLGIEDPLNLKFAANRYGPYADGLRHLMNSMDGSYLHCDKRINDADAFDVIWFDVNKRDVIDAYFKSAGKEYKPVIDLVDDIIDGFQSPMGMEALATVDWLLATGAAQPTVPSIREGISRWPAGRQWAERKMRVFDDQVIQSALERLSAIPLAAH